MKADFFKKLTDKNYALLILCKGIFPIFAQFQMHMKLLLKQVRIISPASPFHQLQKDILIQNGKIQLIEDHIAEEADQVITGDDLHVSIGWMDMFAHFADPGAEHRETIATGAIAAAAGGFTDVMIIPNTKPVIDSKTQVEYVLKSAKDLPVNIYPIGAITKNTEGKELAEMYDMYHSGAIAFSDGTKPVQQANIMIKALQYALAHQTLTIQLPDDTSISNHGLINEGVISTQLGLPGKPSIAEKLIIARDIELMKYTGARLHFTGISTQKSLNMILAAKQEGWPVTCSVTPYHLYFCDEDLQAYNTHLKVNPPLRNRTDHMALQAAFQRGDIDALATHHQPLHWDDKTCEFEYAKYGMIGLETAFAVANEITNDLSSLIKMLTLTPRQLTGVSVPEIEVGAKACLTIFEPSTTYTFTKDMVKSRSYNTPFIGKTLKGKVRGIINNNQSYFN